MAFTNAEISQMFEIFKIPESGRSINVKALVHYPFSMVENWTPNYTSGDLTVLVTAIKANIALATATVETRARTFLTRWDEITASSPLKVTQSINGSVGVIVDHEQERRNIRVGLANLLGLAIPEGGYLSEMQAIYGKGIKDFENRPGDR